MTAHAIFTASLICLGKTERAGRMREWNRGVTPGHVTEFLNGMHKSDAGHGEQPLPKNRLLSLTGKALTVLCLDGELWLTREGDIEDYILSAGQSFTLRAADRAAVQALRSSRIRLLPA